MSHITAFSFQVYKEDLQCFEERNIEDRRGEENWRFIHNETAHLYVKVISFIFTMASTLSINTRIMRINFEYCAVSARWNTIWLKFSTSSAFQALEI